MYTGTTVLGEFSELQYSLSPSYQAARLLVITYYYFIIRLFGSNVIIKVDFNLQQKRNGTKQIIFN